MKPCKRRAMIQGKKVGSCVAMQGSRRLISNAVKSPDDAMKSDRVHSCQYDAILRACARLLALESCIESIEAMAGRERLGAVGLSSMSQPCSPNANV